jgi:hypothetical protein
MAAQAMLVQAVTTEQRPQAQAIAETAHQLSNVSASLAAGVVVNSLGWRGVALCSESEATPLPQLRVHVPHPLLVWSTVGSRRHLLDAIERCDAMSTTSAPNPAPLIPSIAWLPPRSSAHSPTHCTALYGAHPSQPRHP